MEEAYVTSAPVFFIIKINDLIFTALGVGTLAYTSGRAFIDITADFAVSVSRVSVQTSATETTFGGRAFGELAKVVSVALTGTLVNILTVTIVVFSVSVITDTVVTTYIVFTCVFVGVHAGKRTTVLTITHVLVHASDVFVRFESVVTKAFP
jgi:hypothetical protein